VEKTTYLGALLYVLPSKYHSGGQTKKSEMGGACSTYGGRGEVYTGFWWGNVKEREHLNHQDVDGG